MKFRLLAFALLLSGGVSAQNPYISLQGANETAGGLTVAQPRTILAVDVTVEHDVTLSGPYARYAQKYLGVRAPLTDKTVWSVTGAQIALLDGDTYLNAAAPAPASTRVLSHTASENKFARLQPDKTDMTTPALEDAARTAAAQIFSLRRHRIELVTGEAGENVFGEGLKAALEEIDRLEQSYLELFLGKRIVSTETRRYVVCPQADQETVYRLPLQPCGRTASRHGPFGRHRAVADRTFGRCEERPRGRSEGDAGRGVPRGRSLDLHRRLGRPRVCPRRASCFRIRSYDQRRPAAPQITFRWISPPAWRRCSGHSAASATAPLPIRCASTAHPAA